MEEDDEFGDLYTDVLKPLTSSSSSFNPPPTTSNPTPPSPLFAVDLSQNDAAEDQPSTISRAPPPPPPQSNSSTTHSIQSKTLAQPINHHAGPNSATDPRVLDLNGPKPPSSDSEKAYLDHVEPRIEGLVENKDSGNIDSINSTSVSGHKDASFMDGDDVKFDIEEGNNSGSDNNDPVIPGLSGFTDRSGGGGGGGGGSEDWEDSDSEDELQIVLDDNTNVFRGHMGVMGGGGGEEGEDDDDEDDDELVIVAGGDQIQPLEEQEWGGEDAGQTGTEGERKETGGGEAAKTGGGAVAVPKISYNSYGYHSYNSQFKYVRPGAAPIPGSSTTGQLGAPNQVRPPIGPLAGRGRGEWRPTGIKGAAAGQKSFHSGYGGAGWGSGRGFGGGLDFTLPSHKTIFEVDIDSFEEKPWKYPGVDITDFFNFGLNEESWKDYCKQLEQHRLEGTMQSKIRVYESGRTDQEFDPDMPPELAAATGLHEIPAENSNIRKSDAGQIENKAPVRVRAQLPVGRPIQVETGYGERLPSIDSRPPRIRDSDAIIEIICQDAVDDVSSIDGMPEQADNDVPSADLRRDQEGIAREDAEYSDGFPKTYSGQKEELTGGSPVNSGHDITKEDEISQFSTEASVPHSRNTEKERHAQGRRSDSSPYLSPTRSTDSKKVYNDRRERSVGSIDEKMATPQSSMECKSPMSMPADGSSEKEKEERALDSGTAGENSKDDDLHHRPGKRKLSSRDESSLPSEFDDGDELRAARSSENSKARSGSSRDYHKYHDGIGEEVIQAAHSTRAGISSKRHLDNDVQDYRRKDRETRQEIERNRLLVKERDDSHRDWDHGPADSLQMKSKGLDRRKGKDNHDASWQRRDDDTHDRRVRPEDVRRMDHGDDSSSRHRYKGQDSERSDRGEYPFSHSRKNIDNGIYKVKYDKDIDSRPRERDDYLKGRHENPDDYYSKRRKEDDYLRRDHGDREEVLHMNRESTSRRKRERDEVMDYRKREDQPRGRDDNDDRHSAKHRDEILSHRERSERQRGRDEWQKLKQSHDENLSRREKGGQGVVRGGPGVEDKVWVGHSRVRDDYKVPDKEYLYKDTSRRGEQLKRRERPEDETSLQLGGREDAHARNNYDERRPRQDRSSSRNDHSISVSENQRSREKKHKESMKKRKEPEGGDEDAGTALKRSKDDKVDRVNYTNQSTRKQNEDASSDDEQSNARRGRSKLERWTSHKEREYNMQSNSSSLKYKEVGRNGSVGSIEASKVPDESNKAVEAVKSNAEENVGGDGETKNDVEMKTVDNQHLDTVEKLKKRSERFKLPMPSEKEALAIKKMENEALPSTKAEPSVDTEIKHERPARKRRWIND